MKLEIKLSDPNYCDGCPCLAYVEDYWCYYECRMDYDVITREGNKMLRPTKCKEENGE